MLASAGARLLRPKLAASFGAWRRDWELLARVVKSNAERGRDREIVRQRLALQAEVERLQSNLASCVEEARSERFRCGHRSEFKRGCEYLKKGWPI